MGEKRERGKMKNQRSLITIIIFSLLFLSGNIIIFTSMNTAASENKETNTVLYVGGTGPQNYTSIQNAVDNATEGDTVYVSTGIYYEKVNLTKSINLIGEDKEKTVICNPGIIVYVSTAEVTIKNFTITGGEVGIYLHNATNTNILNCKLSYTTKHGIYFRRSSNNTIVYTEIFSNAEDGIRLDYSSSYNTISDSSISENGLDGISIFQTSNHNIISDTNISSNGVYGIFIATYSSYNTILNSNISKNQHGIYLSNSSHNFITNSTISSSDYVGVGFHLSSNNCVVNSTIVDNYAGFHLSNSTNNLIFHNNIINNTYQAFDIEGNNSWDNGVEGNYWSDYAGGDANEDGVGDTPYIIDSNSRDNFPLIIPFNGVNKQQITTVGEGSKTLLLIVAILAIIIIVGIIILAKAVTKKLGKGD